MSAPFPPSALDGVEAAVEPHVRKATDAIYIGVMESVQEYLRDNAGYNIGQQIATANREAVYTRGRLAEVMADRDRLFAALSGLKSILDAAESNASGNAEWERVHAQVKVARGALAMAGSK